MKELSLDKINEKSPYHVSKSNTRKRHYIFETRHGVYLCDTSDKKQEMRNRLFSYWFSSYRSKANFTMLSTSILDADGVLNCASLILRNDNPKYMEVMSEFNITTQVLSTKP